MQFILIHWQYYGFDNNNTIIELVIEMAVETLSQSRRWTILIQWSLLIIIRDVKKTKKKKMPPVPHILLSCDYSYSRPIALKQLLGLPLSLLICTTNETACTYISPALLFSSFTALERFPTALRNNALREITQRRACTRQTNFSASQNPKPQRSVRMHVATRLTTCYWLVLRARQ